MDPVNPILTSRSIRRSSCRHRQRASSWIVAADLCCASRIAWLISGSSWARSSQRQDDASAAVGRRQGDAPMVPVPRPRSSRGLAVQSARLHPPAERDAVVRARGLRAGVTAVRAFLDLSQKIHRRSGLRLSGRVGAGGWGFQPRPMALQRRRPPPNHRASETRRPLPAPIPIQPTVVRASLPAGWPSDPWWHRALPVWLMAS